MHLPKRVRSTAVLTTSLWEQAGPHPSKNYDLGPLPSLLNALPLLESQGSKTHNVFLKIKFYWTQLCLFSSMLLSTAFVQSLVVATETKCPAKPKKAFWPFTEKVCQPMLQAMGRLTGWSFMRNCCFRVHEIWNKALPLSVCWQRVVWALYSPPHAHQS